MTTVVADVEVDELVVAWARWSEQPFDRARACAMAEACAPLAARVGIDVIQFRDRLATAARGHRERLAQVVDLRACVTEALDG